MNRYVHTTEARPFVVVVFVVMVMVMVMVMAVVPVWIWTLHTLLHNAPKGAFQVTVVDAQDAIGGLWPTSKSDTGRLVHPLMVANQSRHTMHFSDLGWDEDAPQLPRAWQVGKYLERYMDRYLTGNPDFELVLGTRVVKTEPSHRGSAGWEVLLRGPDGKEETRTFQKLIVASGYFGKPIIPQSLTASASVPVVPSSQYRDLDSLLGDRPAGKGRKILVVGGQMSGVEIAGTIASHLSSAINSPEPCAIPDIDKYSVHHVVQRPIWVFPLYTTPEPTAAAAPFLPLDFSSYNRNNRPQPLVNTQGHISPSMAKVVHGIYEKALGSNQAAFSPLLCVDDDTKTQPPYLAVSDWYCDFVRSGQITLHKGKVEALDGDTAVLSNGGGRIDDVAAVVVATGFDPSPCLDFFPKDVLDTMHFSPKHTELPLALAFHGATCHDLSNLGFVGFYRSPYWGVMQMQARFLVELWTKSILFALPMRQALSTDDSMRRILELRDDPRLSQFPMGDYPWLMQEFAQALSIEPSAPSFAGVPLLPHNNQPLDMLTPARYSSLADSEEAKAEAARLMRNTLDTTIAGLTSPKFVARAVFRSLLGTWKLERDLTSRLPSHPSGHFSGTAQFLLRKRTSDGIQCAKDGTPASYSDDDEGMEYLYIEDGEFKTDGGFGFRATRRYVWRYDEPTDTLSVWFAKPEDQKRADYLFHEVEFVKPDRGGRDADGWKAKAGHLCIDDYYDVKYNFAFEAVNLRDWTIEYTVNGPKKDYTIHGTYTR
ncbi:pyridine nucleotide-disulfide oxidoreductase [Purpureocillium lavendulum]|uniref:Pyridine nucleotide-disulfide oxidoreductase n=1 Tax=Purpureocillium lavendulum TaxID=1247861 RepID=A0AB34G061_9HYPO|nr:pyridine nucleotide-disulfide oxidoreductase [Purpureocillium lavendulum]